MMAEWVLAAWFSNDGTGGEPRFVITDGLTSTSDQAKRFDSLEAAKAYTKLFGYLWANPVKVDDLDAWVIMKMLASEVGGTDLREIDCSYHGILFWDGIGCSVCSRERTQSF